MLLQAGVVACVAVPAARAGAAESCADSASESLRTSLNYATASPDAARTCGGCAFFTGDESMQACGQCVIMSGHVDEGGICDSWAAKE